jgi:repressor LexA
MSEGSRRRGRRAIEALTDSQRRTLRLVREFIARHQFPPTTQELAVLLGIASASAHEQLNQLVRKGYLRREPRKARGLTVVRDAEDPPAELVAVPLVGTVQAGLPVLAEENIVGEVLVEGHVVRSGSCFALRVAGDSMAGAGISDRDVVIVRQQPIAESGDIVVALLDGEATVKRLSIQGPRIELCPENPRFRPLPVAADSDFRVLGKVVGVRRADAR